MQNSRALIQLTFLNASQTALGTYESASISASDPGWQELSVVTPSAPLGTTQIRCRLYLEKPNGTQGQTIANFDDAYLELTSNPTTPEVDIYPLYVGLDKSQTSREFDVRNTGTGSFAWSLTTASPWIAEISPSSGTLNSGETQTVALAVDRSGLTDVLYKGSVSFTAAGGVSREIVVYMDMTHGYDVPALPSRVTIRGRRLIVERRLPDGTLDAPLPFVVKGAAWSPAGKGSGGSLTERRQEFHEWYVADVQLLKEMNANTVYTFIDLGTDASALDVLDNLYKNGIMAIITVDEDGTYNTGQISEVVAAYKNHPALLFWAIGNEWNINYYHQYFSNLTDAAEATQAAALEIKALDEMHPVATVHGEIDIDGQQPLQAAPGFLSTYEIVNTICPAVDVWGLNIYAGDNFGSLFDQWGSITGKPMFLSEFGTDSFFTTDAGAAPVEGYPSEESQIDYLQPLWSDLNDNISAYDVTKVSLGGTVFEWTDEWWKVPVSAGGSPDVQDTGGFPTPWNLYAHPDGFANEEWFGIVNIARQPKQAYEVLTDAFAQQPNLAPLVVGQDALQIVGGSSIEITLDNVTITDYDSDYPGAFNLQVQDGEHYTRSGNTITPEPAFVGTLIVPVIVNDGLADSDPFDLQVTVTTQTGSLMVTLTPQEAQDAGAQWRVDGGSWQDSGATVGGLAPGPHTVSFKVISGWLEPVDQTVTVIAGQTAVTVGNWVGPVFQLYTSVVGGHGTLLPGIGAHVANVTVLLTAVPDTGYQVKAWTGTDNDSLTTTTNTVTMTDNKTVTVEFEPIPFSTGSLIVTILPAGAVSAGARWRVDGGTWQNSGSTVTGLSVGSHLVSFKEVAGWTTPSEQTVAIAVNQTTSATGTYEENPPPGCFGGR